MKAFILAGGFATRLWPLTEKRAKPMLLIDGKPILKHILDQIPAQVEVYLLTNSQFAASLKTFLKTETRPVHIFCEDTHCDAEKLGALAAVATAIEHYKIKDDLLVLAGDNLLPELDITQLFPAPDDAHLAAKLLPNKESARAFGVVETMSDDYSRPQVVTNFEEKPTNPKSNLVSTGFMGIGKNLLPKLIKFSKQSPDALGAVMSAFLTQGVKVHATVVNGDWFDVGSYEAYLQAHKTLQSEALKIEATAEVTNCEFKGKVFIAAGAKVSHSVLVDTVVYPDTVLENCRISQSVIDQKCILKGVDLSMKLVREGTSINNKAATKI